MSSTRKAPDYDLTDPDIVKYCEKNEAELKFSKFSTAIAWDLGCALRAKFEKQYGTDSMGAVIQIRAFPSASPTTPNILFTTVVGPPGSTRPDNWNWVEGKARVVARFAKSSFRVGREFETTGRKPEDKGLPFPEFACHGGGFPIWLTNNDVAPVGIILVSGLPQAEDHQLIVDTLEEFLSTLKQ